MGPNDVELVRVFTKQGGNLSDITLETGTGFEVSIEAEVGNTLFSNGGSYEVKLIIRDFSDVTDGSDVIFDNVLPGAFGDVNWPVGSEKNTFTITVPAATITGREGHIMEAMTLLTVGGVGPQPPDVSFERSPLFTAHAP